jgi:acyl dehydratase
MAMTSTAHKERRLLYLDDLTVGQRFGGGKGVMDEASITAFAAEFDPQPFHLDAAAAAKSLFGRLVASGWHTAALTMRLQVEHIPLAGGLIGAAVAVEWPRPTLPGDVLRIDAEILEVRPSRSRPDRGLVRMVTETSNQRGEVVQVVTATLVVPRRPQ